MMTGYLLGKHIELRFKNGDIERGVVVRMRLSGDRCITLTDEHPEDYDAQLGCWLPRRPREEREYQYGLVESVMVIDRIETLVVDV
jgi:hypothetical protein